MTYFQRLLVNTLTFIGLTVLFPNMVHVSSLLTALLAALILSFLNGFLRPILLVLSLPLTLLSLGLFTFVINAGMLVITSNLVGANHFGFSSFGAAILVAVIMSVVNLIVTEHALQKYTDE